MLGLDPGDRATGRALRERIGLVLQDIAVEPYLTVRVRYEQLSFWRNPQSAFFTFVFPVVIITLFGALSTA